MGRHVLSGNPPIELVLRRAPRARRISLRVSSLDGRVTLSLPRGATERDGLAFAREKEAWLRRHLGARAPEIRVAPGAVVPVLGEPRVVACGAGGAVRLLPGRVLVPGGASECAARLMGHCKALARARLAEASDRHAAALGRRYTRLALRDPRSRWGSCSARGALMYSWRLILAPPEVLDYVAAHEVAHLAHLDHSPAFWATLARLYGDCLAARAWLRREGATLHRYRFGD